MVVVETELDEDAIIIGADVVPVSVVVTEVVVTGAAGVEGFVATHQMTQMMIMRTMIVMIVFAAFDMVSCTVCLSYKS